LEIALQEARTNGNQEEVSRLTALIADKTSELNALYERLSGLTFEISQARQRLARVLDGFYSESRRLAADIADDYPLFAQGWDRFLYYTTSYSSDWSWFGLCHGAAGAALYAPRTQRSVLAR